jgi:hypothetical protein
MTPLIMAVLAMITSSVRVGTEWVTHNEHAVT